MFGALLLGLGACATPAERFDANARQKQLVRLTTFGTPFTHVVYANQHIGVGKVLHVYFGGDGTPWVASRPALDPTPREPLVLDLMAQDKGPAVYLGRPCYHGRQDAACNGWLWTNGRYAEAVVASMTAALDGLLKKHGHSKAVLIGHSGGGTLAMLVAPRIRQTIGVVTIGANLDIDAWTARRGFGRLTGSLNPARQARLPDGVAQFHFAGGRDRIVPQPVTEAGLRGGARVLVVENYDHSCCWADYWPRVLERLAKLKNRTGGKPD